MPSLIFAALALSQRPATVREIAERAPEISQHLNVLERAGLIERTVADPVDTHRALDEASAWVEKHRREWNQRIDTLEEHLKTMIKKEEQ
ncbi:metalloregulator ArsR/SmtB family transcription factor [Paenibacillus elgii]|uniref:helix-turn-helix domain-containing protein n=1 Tax=Paenibacillus elgii TaxID=189691 RepID=UPI002D7C135D|nr:metalloregulator ArsR/SmtB family transcription factor [Paenibacillus elgii]